MDTAENIKKNNQETEASPHRVKLLSYLPVKERQIELAGIPTTYLEGGEGAALVLLHGPGESVVWWMRVIPDLVSNYRVIIPDLPGHGSSGLPDGKLENVSILNWLNALIENLSLQQPVLIGHVVGGAIAARYAVAHPDKLQQLILVDSLGLASFRPAPMFAFELFRFMMNPTEKNYLRFLPQCMYDINVLKKGMGEHWQPFIDYNLACAKKPEVKAAAKSLMGNFSGKIPGKELEKIKIPVTLIWGRHDRANKLKLATQASKKFGWPLHIIEDTRDDPKLEKPVSFVKAVQSSIAEPVEEKLA